MRRWSLLLVAVALLSVYGPHIACAGWVWEDARWQWAITAPVSLGAPRSLTAATWRTTPSPLTAHLLSLSLHVAVVVLLGVLAVRLGYSPAAAGLVAAVMALHPLTVQTAAYAAARTELVAAVGVLLAVLCATGAWRWPWWPLMVSGIILGTAIAWGGKETGLLAVLVLVPLTRLLRVRRPVLVGVGVAVVLSGAVLIDPVGVQQIANIGTEAGVGVEEVRWGPWALLQAEAAWRLVGLSVLPVGLTVDPDLEIVPVTIRWLSVAGLVGMGGLALLVVRRRPRVAYGLLWGLLSLAPRLAVQTPRSLFTDHQWYTPLMGLILAGVAWWDQGEAHG